MYKNILVGYDGSEASDRAITRAIELSKNCGAKVHVVGVIKPLEVGYVECITATALVKYAK